MADKLKNLEPKDFWGWFEKITEIPRGSHKEEKIMKYLVDFASSRGFSFSQDKAGNLLVKKPAQNSSSKTKLLLQAHTDMVWSKPAGSTFDFENSPIDLIIDGDWLRANNTTLGADDGFGVATILCVLDNKEISHPDLECLFTVAEEVGMHGAKELDLPLSATHMINLDSSTAGQITIGCAGSSDYKMGLEYSQIPAPAQAKAFLIKIGNLTSGHSAHDIHKGRANGIKLITRYLAALTGAGVNVASIECAGVRNVISNSGSAIFVVPDYLENVFQELTAKLTADIREEYKITEVNMTIDISSVPLPVSMIDPSVASKMILALRAVVNGAYKFNQNDLSVLEASSNFAHFIAKDGKAEAIAMQRSSSDSALADIGATFAAPFLLAGFTLLEKLGYGAWRPRFDSQFTKMAVESYKSISGEDPIVKVVHSGLEPSMIDKEGKMECISIGMNLKDLHTYTERVQISSAKPFQQYVFLMLSKI